MQKFNKGDLVQIAKDLGQTMSHFKSDQKAIVSYSYADKYGGGVDECGHEYGLVFSNGSTSAWYYEHQLELIAKDKWSLAEEWMKKRNVRIEKESDIDYIFAHPEKALSGNSIPLIALGRMVGIKDMWGSQGEYVTLASNCTKVFRLAQPYLAAKDKEGWIKRAEEIKKHKEDSYENQRHSRSK